MAEAAPTRARGRARGRVRGLQPDVRRPAETPTPSQPAESRGRAARRGTNVQGVTQQVSRMGLGSGEPSASADESVRPGCGRGANRGRPEQYEQTAVPLSKQGKAGDKVKLAANYFVVETLPQRSIHQYHVTFDPEVENPRARRAMMYDHKSMFNGVYQFDGMAAWSTKKLLQEETEVYSKRSSDDAKIRIKIKFIKELGARDPILMQIFNIQQRKNFAYMDFKEIDRQYYDLAQTIQLPEQKIELIPGFVTAIRQHEQNVLMNLESKFKFVRQDTVLSIMRQNVAEDAKFFKQNSERELLGTTVMTIYNSATYRIDEIEWNMSPRDTFARRRGVGEITYVEYLKQQYNLTVKDLNQPLLMSKPKPKDLKRGDVTVRYLLPEFCVMTGLDDKKRADYKAMREVAKHTKLDPNGRVNVLHQFMQRMKNNPKVIQDMENWEFKFSNDLVKIDGRSLECQNIITTGSQADEGKSYDKNTADWSKIVRGRRLLEPVCMTRWILVHMHTQKDVNIAKDFLDNLIRVTQTMGLIVKPPQRVICPDDRTQTYASRINETIDKDTQMVVVIVPNNRKDRYDMVKKICCLELGVPSQVIVTRTLMSKAKLMSVATNIAIQMNCKMGGQVWRVKIPMSNAMVVGIDTYHDSAQRNKSVCAIVCTMNSFYTKCFSQVSFQATGQEMSDAFVIQLALALKNYRKVNQKLPDKIFFYRDGVGDGQLAQVRDWEIPQIEKAIQSLQVDGYKPKIAFFVVNKRINTRFFLDNGPNRPWGNPLSGTVIDNVVTRPERYDFFLVSQSVREGTVGPTQYNVIYDTTNFSPDQMQKLTYMLTHLYYNWQGTVRVPSVCQYAHKLAFLVGQSLHATPNNRLADTLYYL